jgi:hypothetical protein
MDSLSEANSGGVGSRTAKPACLRDSSGDRSGGTEDIDYEAEYTSDEPCEDKDDSDSETTDAEVNPDNEASQFMERLVRRHLESVMESHRMADIPLSGPFAEAGPQSVIVSVIAAALEQDSDIVLARLLEAVISAHRTAQGGLTGAIEDFLKQTFNVMLFPQTPGSDEGTAFLRTVIEQLVRHEANDDDTSSPEQASDSTTVSSITVFVSDSAEEIALEDILSCFWSSKLETDCHHCHQPFENEPPISTIAQESSIAQMSSSKLHVRVFNRHSVCLKANETFMVPVSHVWDNSIRAANESRAHNGDAALAMLGTLKALFKGAEDAYGPDVEFWHDYFSVPQWEPKTKESLLLRLPAIYHSSDEILVHMSDLPTGSAIQLLLGRAMGEEISIKQAIQRIPLLGDLCRSQWMQRMWVTLEYSQAKAACVMDQSNTIWRNKEVANGLFARDTFTQLVNGGSDHLVGMFRWAKTFARTMSRPGNFLGGLATRRNMQERQLCLGEVMELISMKQCQIFRDRFLAIHIILNPNPTPNDPPPIPGTDTDACLWVWRSALSKGDHSPLLLQPRECVSLSDPEPPLPSWLVGCRSVDGAEWDLGNQETAPKENPVVTEVSVKVVLNQVGEIRAIHYLDTQDSGEVEGVNQVMQILVAIAHTEGLMLSPKDLYDVIGCVFPFDRMHSRMARAMLNMVFSFDERQTQDSEFSTKLSEHLGLYTEVSGEGRKSQVLDAAQSITTLLQLDTHIAEVTRLTRSRHVARRRKARGAVKGEPLCEVRCPKCHKTTLLRLDLRVTGNVGDIVYRIPGLSYSESIDDGIGLVLRDGRITGRMFYGKPACNCQLQETVEIW